MKKRIFRALCVFLLLGSMSLPAFADTGPKPSVNITLKNLPAEPCYVTLLSTVPSTGPHSSVWRVNEAGERVRNYDYGSPYEYVPEGERHIYDAFLAYEEADPDRLYFLQTYGLAEDGTYRWGYYPPMEFKVLLYFPGTGAFAVTDELCERYAFDSYFTVDLSGVELVPGETVSGLKAVKSYDYTWELISLCARVVITIALELAVAWWFFGLRTKRALAVILPVNLVTQVALNVGLNWRAYVSGHGYLLLPYLLMELGVLVVEMAAYWLLLPRDGAGKRPAKLAFRYALAANVVSFVAGWGIALVIPGIF